MGAPCKFCMCRWTPLLSTRKAVVDLLVPMAWEEAPEVGLSLSPLWGSLSFCMRSRGVQVVRRLLPGLNRALPDSSFTADPQAQESWTSHHAQNDHCSSSPRSGKWVTSRQNSSSTSQALLQPEAEGPTGYLEEMGQSVRAAGGQIVTR